jgi:protein-L-isoaspartate(D-aspartate) O-methyltransferase
LRYVLIALVLALIPAGAGLGTPATPATPASPAGAPRATPAAAQAWTYAAFLKAFEESGRKTRLTETGFAQVQERKARALKLIESYLKGKFGEADPQVVRAFAEVPREYFHYDYGGGRAFPEVAYEEEPKPWPIGFGSALSDYLGQAYMTQLARVASDHTVLEIGTGSGFQAAIFSRMAKRVYTIEIVEPLGKAVARIFRPLGYDTVEVKVGDGYFGWPDPTEGFDVIMFTCAAPYVPSAVLAQLKPGGRLIVPIGQPFKRGQFLYVFTREADGRVRSRKDVGVYFVPMTGEVQKRKQ